MLPAGSVNEWVGISIGEPIPEYFLPLPCLSLGGGSWMMPSSCILIIATRQLIAFSWPSGLRQLKASQTSFDKKSRDADGFSEIIRLMVVICSAVNSLPR